MLKCFVHCDERPKALPLETAIFFKKLSKTFVFILAYMPCYPSLRRSRTGCRLNLPSERRVRKPKLPTKLKRETALVLSQKVQPD